MGIKERIFSPLPRDVSLEELVPKSTSTAAWRRGSISRLSGNSSRTTLALRLPSPTRLPTRRAAAEPYFVAQEMGVYTDGGHRP